jgi:DNA-binding NarL/FixJ family response regulator
VDRAVKLLAQRRVSAARAAKLAGVNVGNLRRAARLAGVRPPESVSEGVFLRYWGDHAEGMKRRERLLRVLEMRAAGKTQREIGEELDMHQSGVSKMLIRARQGIPCLEGR